MPVAIVPAGAGVHATVGKGAAAPKQHAAQVLQEEVF